MTAYPKASSTSPCISNARNSRNAMCSLTLPIILFAKPKSTKIVQQVIIINGVGLNDRKAGVA